MRDDERHDPMESGAEELTEIERQRLRSLAQGPAPPEELEARVVAALKAGGLLSGETDGTRQVPPLREPEPQSGRRLRSRRGGASHPLLRWAAALALFTAGAAVGAGWPRGTEPTPAGPGFVLLLLPGEGAAPQPGTDAERRRVEEHRQWVQGLRRADVAIRGEKLEAGGRLLEPVAAPAPPEAAAGTEIPPSLLATAVQGYFVLHARDDEEALHLARSCPHLRHGGRILLRRIEPT